MRIETESWQGLINQLVTLFGRGYFAYHLTQYPEKKRAKWPKIDAKLVQKYALDGSIHQRYRLRKKGFCTYAIVRWEAVCVILKTQGKPMVTEDDKFNELIKRPLAIRISDNIILEIQRVEDKVTARLSKRDFEGFEEWLVRLAGAGQIKEARKVFDRLNGLPGFHGINQQKWRLWSRVVATCKRAGISPGERPRINTRRKVVQVYKPQG